MRIFIILKTIQMKTLKLITSLLTISAIIGCASCSTDDSIITPVTPVAVTPVDTSAADLGITTVPTSLGTDYTSNFISYTNVSTPNGGSIHIVAQNLITNEQIVRCRGILEHYLKNYPGSTYGADKSAVANKMADNGAVLTLLNGQDDGSNNVQVNGQPLFQNEIQVEGQSWYTNQNYEHRDATYEEILHLVHDYGIGINGPNTLPGALPAYQTEIRAAQDNADNGFAIWPVGGNAGGVQGWYNELTAENSLSQEYLASLIDSYYGLWGAWSDANEPISATHGMWGLYVAKTRSEIITEDPTGQGLLNNKFFHPYITYNARIDSNFSGTFSLKYDAGIKYSNHSRYLKDITLLGANNTNVHVNELDNDITGNIGSNTIIFDGNYSEYSVNTTSEVTTVTDNTANRNGSNILINVEKLQFTDQTIDL